MQLELMGGVDLTNECQHGFKKNRGTVTAGLQLQSLIWRALDDDNFVAMGSLDLSAAFDVVDVPLLMKRLRILGLPYDIIELNGVWFKKYANSLTNKKIYHLLNYMKCTIEPPQKNT